MDSNSLYERPLLGKLAQRYTPRDAIALLIFKQPVVPVELIEYLVWGRGPTFKRKSTVYGEMSSANVADLLATRHLANLRSRGQAAWVTQKERKQYKDGDIKASKLQMLKDIMMLDLECEVAAMLRDTAQLTLNDTLVGAAQWSDAASDPKKAVLGYGNELTKRPNTLIVGKQVDDIVQLHPKILEAVKYTMGGVEVTKQTIARYFGVDRYLVGEMQQDIAAEGQNESLSFIWGKDAILCYIDPNEPDPLMQRATLGYCPIWEGEVGSAGPWRVYEKAPDPERGTGEGAQYMKLDASYQPLLTAADYGVLIKNAVA